MFFDNGIFDIAYSAIGLAPINTCEHYQLAAAYDFDALKGDIRITRDGALVMCHDPGFTLDAEGRIGKFDRANQIPILDLTLQQVQSLRYSAMREKYGYALSVATLDDFVRICAQTGKAAYITARQDRIPEIVTETLRILKKYDMTDRSVLNSFCYETLQEVRRRTDSIPLSNVFPRLTTLTVEQVRAMAELGNAIVTPFFFESERGYEAVAASAPAFQEAKKLGVALHMAQIAAPRDRENLIRLGFTGFQLLYPLKK